MRPFVRLKVLHANEYMALKKTAVSRKLPAGKVRRAKFVLLSLQGHTVREIAQKLDCNERTALRWINASISAAWPVAGSQQPLRYS